MYFGDGREVVWFSAGTASALHFGLALSEEISCMWAE